MAFPPPDTGLTRIQKPLFTDKPTLKTLYGLDGLDEIILPRIYSIHFFTEPKPLFFYSLIKYLVWNSKNLQIPFPQPILTKGLTESSAFT